MKGCRKRIGEAGCEFLLGLTAAAGLATGTVAKTSLTVAIGIIWIVLVPAEMPGASAGLG
jgi:hypothetical protein